MSVSIWKCSGMTTYKHDDVVRCLDFYMTSPSVTQPHMSTDTPLHSHVPKCQKRAGPGCSTGEGFERRKRILKGGTGGSGGGAFSKQRAAQTRYRKKETQGGVWLWLWQKLRGDGEGS